ncbi:HdeD family acid-resistance protein [Paenarthrobacter sp. NPDC056912]|uniref:HdeD family acid-resistance protein n=1 Tax=Paenarthrobacter sp. NPDC056912 TaxID=3345965 RepID=UPI00366C1227
MSDVSARRMYKHSGTALMVRGVLAIVFGLLIIALPSATAFVVVIMFGVFAIVDGITNVAHYFYDPAGRSRWSMVGGFISIAAGIVAVAWPGFTASAVGVLIGLWALVLGLSQLVLSLAARSYVRSWGIWFLTGVITTVFGIVVLVNPGVGFLALVGMLAVFAILSGILLIASGIGLRKLAASPPMYAH